LAEAIQDLALVHVAMGALGNAEKEGLEALRIRERVGDPMAIVDSRSHLAGVYLRRHEYTKAVEFGQKAMDVLDGGSGVDPVDRIALRFTVARALCGAGSVRRRYRYSSSRSNWLKGTYGKDALPGGLGYYLLGYAYWHTGDMAGAAEWMERGTTRMKVELGWGHPMYVDAMGQYALFLRERGRTEEAAVVEQEIRRAEAVVDVRSLPQHTRALGLTGPR
jgi:hypothetical protein